MHIFRKSTAEMVFVYLEDASGNPKPGVLATDVAGSQVQFTRAGGTKTYVSLGSGNWVEVDATESAGVYRFAITTTESSEYGMGSFSVRPAASLFRKTQEVFYVETNAGAPAGTSLAADIAAAIVALQGTGAHTLLELYNAFVDIKGAGWASGDSLKAIQAKTANLPATAAASAQNITDAVTALQGAGSHTLLELYNAGVDIKGAGWASGDSLKAIQAKTTALPNNPASTQDVTTARSQIQDSITAATGIDVSQNSALIDALNGVRSALQSAALRGR